MNFFHKIKKNAANKKIVLNIIAPVMALSLLGSLSAALPGCGGKPDPTKGKAELVFWGVFDDSDVFGPLIKSFNETYKGVKITYRKETYTDYEKDLVDAMAAGRGPDIFMIENDWLPKHIDKISPIPDTTKFSGEDSMLVSEFKNSFVDVAAQDFIWSGTDAKGNALPERIYALPLFVDTLALYWNKDLFNSASISLPPANWDEFNKDVELLTKKDESNNILMSGASIGTVKNINRGSDILMMLMLQTGAEMVNLTRGEATFDEQVSAGGQMYQPGLNALQFYTNFADPSKKSYTWNNNLDYSIDAFSQGKSAMMINYSFHINTIRAKQPHLRFGIAPIPQPKDSQVDVTYPNYWGVTVSASADANKQTYAWVFLKWLTSQPQAQQYLDETMRPAARRDLVDYQQSSVELGVYARQSLTARSWYQVNNLDISAIFDEMIDSVNNGQNFAEQALTQAAGQVTVLMQKKLKK
jgi:multiple sugar transport system substrate-binding protein